MKVLFTALSLSTSGFHAWRYSNLKVKPLANLVIQNYNVHKGEIGALTLTQEIITQLFKTSCSSVARAMRKLAMKAK